MKSFHQQAETRDGETNESLISCDRMLDRKSGNSATKLGSIFISVSREFVQSCENLS